MKQYPATGEHKLYFRGDILEVKLELDEPLKGHAYFRTNIGSGSKIRFEIISSIETHRTSRGESWHDFEMTQVDGKCYEINISLLEVGHFEGKCLFIEDETEHCYWVGGENINVNVEPEAYCAGNTLYCAFPRQFGPNKSRAFSESKQEVMKFEEQGYTVIPHSGTFRDLAKEVDFIFNQLNCKILHLLPINPTPTTYGKMGVFGSPYAALDFTAIDPSLAEFDKSATPLEQFIELVDQVHQEDGKLFIDIAINHTGWASKIHEEHPEWLLRNDSGEIKSPGAWGVVWEDLTELDYSSFELWKYLVDAFLTWCERGVDGFRCDAGYMIPLPAWRYIISKVRCSYPNTVFLLEGLGGDPKVTESLLNKGNMNWAYSELFQNFSKEQIINYIGYSDYMSRTHGLMFHYAETHDNLRLAEKSPQYSSMRTALCAMLSSSGGFGFTNGVEWFAQEKIDVHHDSALNWGAEVNQVDFIARINTLLRNVPAFYQDSIIEFHNVLNNSALVFSRTSKNHDSKVLILVNLDVGHHQVVQFEAKEFSLHGTQFNLLTDTEKMFIASSAAHMSCTMDPGEVICVMPSCLKEACYHKSIDPVRYQAAKVMALSYLANMNDTIVTESAHVGKAVDGILSNPQLFCREFSATKAVKVVEWKAPRDLNRMVMVPPGHFILMVNDHRFRARLSDELDVDVIDQQDSIVADDGTHFVLLKPFDQVKNHTLKSISIYTLHDGKMSRRKSQLLLLSDGDEEVDTFYDNRRIVKREPVFLATNNRAGMTHVPVAWGQLYSRYDALLAGNLNADFPVDRQVMLTRLRLWVSYQGYSHALDVESLESFYKKVDGSGVWKFYTPIGNGKFVEIRLKLSLDRDEDRIVVEIARRAKDNRPQFADDEVEVKITCRPDIEDRNFHQDTKASHGGEGYWPRCVDGHEDGFVFSPSHDRRLHIQSTGKAIFKREDEWYYSVFHKVEASRGLHAHSDLYSPGYFSVKLKGNSSEKIQASINCDVKFEATPKEDVYTGNCFTDLMISGMKEFVVNRDNLKTVIAGYPWFLDWGRDTLIAARGLITAGSIDEHKNGTGLLADVEGILQAFARFEDRGTLPNMIHGNDAGNRETSDAPLWLFVAISDFCQKIGSYEFIEAVPEGADRTVKDILTSIVNGYINGTVNGIKVDPSSFLVYSPSHFTWMDTNYPAGSPREGYPIEIQSLWYAALSFLHKITGLDEWRQKATMVKESIIHFFRKPNRLHLSDCLHCQGYQPAANAVADDALRCNQLFAVTLGAVTDKTVMAGIVFSSQELLVPGAIRSLADRPVKYHLPVFSNDGRLLNNPEQPFWPRYEGDEDTRRKPAYHNGTAWTWPFPSWVEAQFMTFGESSKEQGKAILSSSKYILKGGCIGQLPEIIDGGFPHQQRGCDAQAWGVTELYRVWNMIN